MNFLAVIALVLTLTEGRVFSQQHLSLEAHETASGTSSYDVWRTPWGSYDRTTTASKKIVISVRNFGAAPAVATVTMYFVIPDSATSFFVYQQTSRAFDLTKLRDAKAQIAAPAVSQRTVNLAALGTRYTEGNLCQDWIAVGVVNGQRFGISASSMALIEQAKRYLARP